MVPTSESPAFDLGVPPMLDIVLPEKADTAIGFCADTEPRIEELARISTEGELTEDEQVNARVIVRANKFVVILK